MKTTAGSTNVEYVRDVADRIIGRKVNGTLVNSYVYTGAGDASDITLDASGNVAEIALSLPGGALYTYKPSSFYSSVWSLMNVHGDTIDTVLLSDDWIGRYETIPRDSYRVRISVRLDRLRFS